MSAFRIAATRLPVAVALACASLAAAASAPSPYVLQVRVGVNDPLHGVYPDLQSALNKVHLDKPASATIQVASGRYVVASTIVVDVPGTTLAIVGDTANPPQFTGAARTIASGWVAGVASGTVEVAIDAGSAFRSLYASDGVVRRRSRFPDYPYAAPIQAQHDPNGFEFLPADFNTDWMKQPGTEIVTMAGYRSARMAPQPDTSGQVDGSPNEYIHFGIPGTFAPSPDDKLGHYRFYAENIPVLQASGQWRIDTDTPGRTELAYMLEPDEHLDGGVVKKANGTPVSFTIPSASFDHQPLLRVGIAPTYTVKSATAPAPTAVYPASIQTNVSITGLMFTQTDWSITTDNMNDKPAADYPGAQAISALLPPAYAAGDTVSPGALGAAVEIYCAGCSFVSSVIADTGGHGLSVRGPNNQVRLNRFARIGGNGVVVGARSEYLDTIPAGQMTANTLVSGNDLHQIGVRHPEGTAIVSYASSGNTIQYNTIDDVTYTGISVGLAQSGEYTLTGNHIDANRISNVLQQLDDGGGIYVCGEQDGSTISGNFVQSVAMKRWHTRAVGFYGLYFDKNSNGFTVNGNFVGPTTNGQVKLSRASYIKILQNYFVVGVNDWISALPTPHKYWNIGVPLKSFQTGPVVEISEGGSDQSTSNLFARYYDAFLLKRFIADPLPGGVSSLTTSNDNDYYDSKAASSSFTDFRCFLGGQFPPAGGCASPAWPAVLDVDSQGMRTDPGLTIAKGVPAADNPATYLPQPDDVALSPTSPALALGIPSLTFGSSGTAGAKTAKPANRSLRRTTN